MRLTNKQLTKIIKEEIDNALEEVGERITDSTMVKQEINKNPEFKKMLQTLLSISRTGEQRGDAFRSFKTLERNGKDFIMGKNSESAQNMRKIVSSIYKDEPVYELIKVLFGITRKNNLRLDVAKKFVDLLLPLKDSELMTKNVKQSDLNDPLFAPKKKKQSDLNDPLFAPKKKKQSKSPSPSVEMTAFTEKDFEEFSQQGLSAIKDLENLAKQQPEKSDNLQKSIQKIKQGIASAKAAVISSNK
tara:strand:- start:66 stop:800 length:735 start_codon:yes stop_codon:yes gene_type:complete